MPMDTTSHTENFLCRIVHLVVSTCGGRGGGEAVYRYAGEISLNQNVRIGTQGSAPSPSQRKKGHKGGRNRDLKRAGVNFCCFELQLMS